ncbi:phosphatase PAP2 family protein [Acinetobacter baretiae]|uniref:phosphatase PAP2 family protein n=1 Tax=Acinetobacter baretiae TaxID=2605383 RepID=UPI0039A747B0
MLNILKVKVLAFDLQWCIYLNQLSKHAYVAYFFKLISRLGDGLFWFVMLVFVWVLEEKYTYKQVIYLACASFLATATYKFLKTKTLRPRPYQVHQVIVLGDRPLDHYSFPSGHTLHAVLATIIFGYVSPILLYLMLPFTVLVALSRVILGLHYPTDVFVGALLGVAFAVVVLMMAYYFHIIL